MHCPTCHYEYESWATQCPDCGAGLAAGPLPTPVPVPLRDYSELRDWGVLTNVPNAIMGNLLKDQLEQAGIPVLMKRSRMSDIAEFSHNDWVMHDLYVPQRYARRARQFLQSAPSEGYLDAYTGDADWDDPGAASDVAIGDVPMPANTPVTWHLIDSANPAPAAIAPAIRNPQEEPYGLPQSATHKGNPTGFRNPPLPSLSHYRAHLDERKHHQAGAEQRGQIIHFPSAGLARPLPAALDEDADPDESWQPSSGPTWLHSRVYRILMGLLLLAWLLPLILQLLQNFGDTWLNWLP